MCTVQFSLQNEHLETNNVIVFMCTETVENLRMSRVLGAAQCEETEAFAVLK